MSPPIVRPVTRWYCPACKATDVTRERRPHSRYHVCPKLGMLSVPMIVEGTQAKIEVREREDYIGHEDVFLAPNGRPVMSIVTTRADGSNDAVVFAPTAHLQIRS